MTFNYMMGTKAWKTDKAEFEVPGRATKIIIEEELQNYNLNEKRNNRENEVGFINNGMWMVYATDERESVVTGSEKIFENKNENWNNLTKY